MPKANRRRYKKRRYARKPKSLYQKGMGYYNQAAWLAKQVWKLKGLVNSEMYKLDTNDGGTTITSGYTQNLTAVAVGDTDITRTGNSIFVRSVNIRGQLVYNATSGVTPTLCRIMVVIDSQQIGDTVPTLADVLESTGGVNAHMNHLTVGRFKVLFSRVYYTDSIDNTVVPININLPMRHHVRYNGTASTDIQKGGIYIMAISDQATNGPKLIHNTRVSYHDN